MFSLLYGFFSKHLSLISPIEGDVMENIEMSDYVVEIENDITAIEAYTLESDMNIFFDTISDDDINTVTFIALMVLMVNIAISMFRGSV